MPTILSPTSKPLLAVKALGAKPLMIVLSKDGC